MTYNIYRIYDRKAGKYITTFTEENDETAKRNFLTIRKDPKTIYGLYPEDFELWMIGQMDDRKGLKTIEENIYVDGGAIINE